MIGEDKKKKIQNEGKIFEKILYSEFHYGSLVKANFVSSSCKLFFHHAIQHCFFLKKKKNLNAWHYQH